MKSLLIAFVSAYRYAISPMLGHHCRFEPSCSEYAIEALRTRGALGGSGLACARLCRCHPWHAGGYDPVPQAQPGQTSLRASLFAFFHRTP